MTNLSHSNEKVLTSYSHLQPWPCKSTQATRYIIIRYIAPKCTISVLEYIKEKERERERERVFSDSQRHLHNFIIVNYRPRNGFTTFCIL